MQISIPKIQDVNEALKSKCDLKDEKASNQLLTDDQKVLQKPNEASPKPEIPDSVSEEILEVQKAIKEKLKKAYEDRLKKRANRLKIRKVIKPEPKPTIDYQYVDKMEDLKPQINTENIKQLKKVENTEESCEDPTKFYEDFVEWDGKTNPLKDMDWIFQNINNNVTKEMAPSPGAYGYIKRIQEDNDLKDEFYKLYINRRLPSKQAIDDMENRLNDDGRDLKEFIEQRIRYITDKIYRGEI